MFNDIVIITNSKKRFKYILGIRTMDIKLHREDVHVVFDMHSSVIDNIYKHKYYGSGYKFHSYITSFNLTSKIVIKYDKNKTN